VEERKKEERAGRAPNRRAAAPRSRHANGMYTEFNCAFLLQKNLKIILNMKKTHFNDIKIKFISILAVYFLSKNDNFVNK
jgi:hypothetical protein